MTGRRDHFAGFLKAQSVCGTLKPSQLLCVVVVANGQRVTLPRLLAAIDYSVRPLVSVLLERTTCLCVSVGKKAVWVIVRCGGGSRRALDMQISTPWVWISSSRYGSNECIVSFLNLQLELASLRLLQQECQQKTTLRRLRK